MVPLVITIEIIILPPLPLNVALVDLELFSTDCSLPAVLLCTIQSTNKSEGTNLGGCDDWQGSFYPIFPYKKIIFESKISFD